VTHFDQRRHPEEFGVQLAAASRGMWNVPVRNALFIGRERELGETGPGRACHHVTAPT
jgi:hypothetical protein